MPSEFLSLKLQATLKRIKESLTPCEKDEESYEYKVLLFLLLFYLFLWCVVYHV